VVIFTFEVMARVAPFRCRLVSFGREFPARPEPA
jgi:hypothetical protein